LPYGAGIESVAAEALLQAEQKAVLHAEREHVCPYLYARPDHFLLHRPAAPCIWQGAGLRITVDTQEDYAAAQDLYADLAEVDAPRRYWGETIINACKHRFTERR
jgi:spore coat polysaccharide biosynthesis protein SpsF (cytidylyltransferase family)